MAQAKSWLDQFKEFLQTDEAVPIISLLLILTLFIFFSEARYFLIETATMLLFYAVLVRMWTVMTPDDSELLNGPFSHGFFLVISAGAVVIGIIIEEWLIWVSGSVLPAQFLALAVLLSRIYLNLQASNKYRGPFLWENKYERYVILIPCLVVVLFPVAVYQLGISDLVLVSANYFTAQTTNAFISLTALGLLIGLASYYYVEEHING